MELKDYTEEQLRAELKRRYDERQKERESIKRCSHCEYMQRFKDYDLYNCRVRTFTRKNRYDKNNPIVVHYSVKPECTSQGWNAGKSKGSSRRDIR